MSYTSLIPSPRGQSDRAGSSGDGNALQRLSYHVVGRRPLHFGFRVEQQAVVEHAEGDVFHVIGGDETDPVESGARLRRREQVLGRTGRSAKPDARVLSSVSNQLDHVVDDGSVAADLRRLLADRFQLR